MDPQYQPQNSSPYPQNNPYYAPETQPTSAKYPTLPSSQNPQYNYPPQQYSSQPQYNPQIPLYPPVGGQGGYIPPAYYGDVQAGQNQDVQTESFLLATKMRELEQGLNSCFVKCYQVWLWLIIITMSMNCFKVFVTLVSGQSEPDGEDIAVSLAYGVWSIVQSVVGVQAISQKSIRRANVACWLMTLYLIPCLVVELRMIDWINSYSPDPYDDTTGIMYFIMYAALFFVSLLILIHVCVTMTGAFRVRKILSERKQVVEKLKVIQDSFRLNSSA